MTKDEFYTYEPRTRLEIYPNHFGGVCIKQINEFDEPVLVITKDQAEWLSERLNHMVHAMSGVELPGGPTGEWGPKT